MRLVSNFVLSSRQSLPLRCILCDNRCCVGLCVFCEPPFCVYFRRSCPVTSKQHFASFAVHQSSRAPSTAARSRASGGRAGQGAFDRFFVSDRTSQWSRSWRVRVRTCACACPRPAPAGRAGRAARGGVRLFWRRMRVGVRAARRPSEAADPSSDRGHHRVLHGYLVQLTTRRRHRMAHCT